MSRLISWTLALATFAFIVAAPYWYWLQRHANYRNFRVVQPGHFFRSGQLSRAGLERTLKDHSIRTVITLRDSAIPGEAPPDQAEEDFCIAQGINYLRLPPRQWANGGNGLIPASENVRRFLEVLDDPKNYPVLIHCFAGAHRTGAYCALYRIEYDHWTNEQALAEMKHCGYKNLDNEEDVSGFIESYKPRWKR